MVRMAKQGADVDVSRGERVVRILHVIDSLGRGGAENLVIGLSREMKSLGHEVAIVALTSCNEFSELTTLYGIEVYHCEFRGSIRSLPSVLKTLVQLGTIARRFRPDVINTHIFFSDIVTRLLLGWRAPIVTTFHRDEEWWSMPKSQSARIKRWLEAVSARHLSRRFIAVSRVASDDAVRYLGIDASRCDVVRNGVDTQRFIPAAATMVSPPAPIILQVARFYPEKCHEVSLQAFRQLLHAFPAAQLWLVGDGPQRSAIQALALQLGIEKQVRFLGLREDVDMLLRESQLFWLSSRREGLPISLLEAMSAGVVPVVTRVGDIPSLVDHGSNGYIADVGDIDAIARFSESALGQNAARAAMAQRARNTVEGGYAIATTARSYLDIYAVAWEAHCAG
jgi:glycosyltransferase involved in cell wall biosynthesis